MICAQDWLDRRINAIRLDCDGDDETRMEISMFMKGLAAAAGTLLRQCGSSEFGSFSLLLAMAYNAGASPAQAAPAAIAPTTLTRHHGRDLRMHKRLSQKELGRLAGGLSQYVITAWETGKKELTAAQYAAIRAVLMSSAPMQPEPPGDSQ